MALRARGGFALAFWTVCALGVASCGCSSGGSGADGGTGGTAHDPDVWVDMPPDVDAKVRALVDEMARLTCERSRNCCGKYGFRPLTSCSAYASTLIVGGAYGHIGPGDPTAFEFHFNEALAQICLDEFRKDKNECVFADQLPLTAWQYACSGTLLVNRKDEPSRECLFDEHCALDPAPGTRCVDDHCLSEVEVPVGAECFLAEGATVAPTCGPLGRCNSSSVCEPRGQAGGSCYAGTDTCVAGYGCVGGVCVPPSPDGTVCQDNGACLEHAYCVCSGGACETDICISSRASGQPCEFELQCQGADTCVNGFCKPDALFLCELPKR